MCVLAAERLVGPVERTPAARRIDRQRPRSGSTPLTQRSLKKHRAYEAFDDFPLIVTCPSLPGLVTYGETLEEARAMAIEAIECYLESLQKDGLPLPVGDLPGAPLTEHVRVKLAAV